MTDYETDLRVAGPAAAAAREARRMIAELADLNDDNSTWELLDAVRTALESKPLETWTPSQVARKLHIDTTDAHMGLRILVMLGTCHASGNGTRTRYQAMPRHTPKGKTT